MKDDLIKRVFGRQVYDSRGRPTVEVAVQLESGIEVSSIAPSGASVGSLEAKELRVLKANGVGSVDSAVENVNKKISKYLVGMSPLAQLEIDNLMIEIDGTDDKSVLGANATLPVSLSIAKAAAATSGLKLYEYLGGIRAKVLPVPMMNIINGGVHADNQLDVQEFMIMPVGASSFSSAMEMVCGLAGVMRSVLKSRKLSVNVGDEGGFAIDLATSDAALDLLLLACEKAGLVPGEDILFALDIAASELFEGDAYSFKGEGERMRHERLMTYYRNLILNYPIFSIEDPFAENDPSGFIAMTNEMGNLLQIVGDDIFVTNKEFLEEGAKNHIANAILIKPNQVGTLSETIDTIMEAERLNYARIISHRSGETEDVTIAHLAVGLGVQQIKTGALARTDRVAKYNELLRIEERLGNAAVYAGQAVLERYKKMRLTFEK